MNMKEIRLREGVSLSSLPSIVSALFPWKNINFNLYGIKFRHVQHMYPN